MTTLGVGNLPFEATEDSIRALFAHHGLVDTVALVTDTATGRPRGYGFVEMPAADARRALAGLNGCECGGRTLKVYLAPAHAQPAGIPRRR